MRFKSFPRPLWLLPVAVLGLGCTSTGGLGRTTQDPKITTIASIGERPVAAVAGVPASSAVADLDPPEPKRDRNARVAGRVVDDRGEPVQGALVRIGVGGIASGRVIEATTDRAGGFTLNGLRPGSTYTLIAEYDGNDRKVSGRWVGRSPQSEVEIALQADDLPDDRRRASKPSPARTISGSKPVDESVSDDTGAQSKVNPEDLAAGSDVEDIDDLAAAPVRSTRTGAVAVSGTGWRKSRVVRSGNDAVAASSDGATRRASTSPTTEPEDDTTIRVPRRTVEDPPAADDEADNPLPPALEPEAPPRRAAAQERDPDPVEPTTRPRVSQRTPVANTPGPGTQPGALTLAKDAPPLEPPPRKSKRSASPTPTAESRPDPEPSLAAWSQLPANEAAPEPDEVAATPKKSTWAAMASAWSTPMDSEPTPSSRPELRQAEYVDQLPAAPSPRPGRDTIEQCRYDSKRQQIVDFRLPNLEGQPVSLADFQSDYILLDFWGTWCRPCMTSVPHFVDLQKRLGSKSLAVVGVACEEGPPDSNAAHVADVAKRLGINYDILLSRKDALSPLQQSLHIQAFPTMILIDRSGRVLWRGVGATTTTLARLDRVLDSATRNPRPDTVRR
jgi:thiol-disulfide isomerase/thioredoxin